MRCSCRSCGTYMVQADDMKLGCVCPECGERCTACLGTNTVISREAFLRMKNGGDADVERELRRRGDID